MFITLFVLKFGLGIFVAFVIVHYFCASPASLAVRRATVTAVQRKGRRIVFTAEHPTSGKVKTSLFSVDTDQNAASLEKALTSASQ